MQGILRSRGRALLVVLVVLVATTAGSASAARLITGKQIKDGTVTSKDLSKAVRAQLAKAGTRGPQGQAGPQGERGPKGDQGLPGAPATNLFAHVRADGTLSATAKGAISAVRADTGNYVVTFNQDVTGCVSIAHEAVVTGEGSVLVNVTALASVSTNSPFTVRVLFAEGSTGNPVSVPFNVATFCQGRMRARDTQAAARS